MNLETARWSPLTATMNAESLPSFTRWLKVLMTTSVVLLISDGEENQLTNEIIVNEHYPVCDKYLIICPNECSGNKIERVMLQDHLDKCPFQVVECEFSHVGCQEKIRRCDPVQHLSNNVVHHTTLIISVPCHIFR